MQRYDLDYGARPFDGSVRMEKADEGDWVRYEDANAEIVSLRQRLGSSSGDYVAKCQLLAKEEERSSGLEERLVAAERECVDLKLLRDRLSLTDLHVRFETAAEVRERLSYEKTVTGESKG